MEEAEVRGTIYSDAEVPRVRIERRLAILDAVEFALDNWTEFSDLVVASTDRVDAIRRVRDRLGINEQAAEHVLELRLGQRTARSRADLRSEVEALRAALAEL